MNRADLIAEALRTLDSAIAIDSTPPNSRSDAEGQVAYLLGRMLGAGDPLDYTAWTREALAALLTTVLQHAPEDELAGIAAEMRSEARWHDSYRVILDLEHRLGKNCNAHDRAQQLSAGERAAAIAREKRRERGGQRDAEQPARAGIPKLPASKRVQRPRTTKARRPTRTAARAA